METVDKGLSKVGVRKIFKDETLQKIYEREALKEREDVKLTPEQKKKVEKVAELSDRFFGNKRRAFEVAQKNIANTNKA